MNENIIMQTVNGEEGVENENSERNNANPDNVFVAKFIGTPPMNILELEFDKASGTLTNGEVVIKVNNNFIKLHDEFYARKLNEFEKLVADFNEHANDEILRILSATGEKFDTMQGKKYKFWSIAHFKELFSKIRKKNQPTEPPENPRKKIAESKCGELRSAYESGKHGLLCGIRPERIKVERYEPEKHDGKSGIIVLKPVVCELLGSEYNIHFVLNGKNFVAQLDAKQVITTSDNIAITFDFADMYVFDPVTGDGIVNSIPV